jgi:ABC-type glycerol-3-phosphate transport system permease component
MVNRKNEELYYIHPSAELMTLVCAVLILIGFFILPWFDVSPVANAALPKASGVELLFSTSLPSDYDVFKHVFPIGNIQLFILVPLAALGAIYLSFYSLRNPEKRSFAQVGTAVLGFIGLVYFFVDFQYAGFVCDDSVLVHTQAYWLGFILMFGLLFQAGIQRSNQPYAFPTEPSFWLRRTNDMFKAWLRELHPLRLLLYVVLIFFSFVAVIPFLWMITQSLMTNNEAQAARAIVPAVPQYCNYVTAWKQANFGEFFVNSVLISSFSIGATLIITILAAYAFARIRFWGRDVMFTLLLMTLMIPEAVIILPNFLTVGGQIVPLPNAASYEVLRTDDGSIQIQNQFTEQENQIRATPENTIFTFDFIGFGGSWMNSIWGLTVPFLASAFSIFLMRQFFAQIPDELWDAARLDGSGHLRFLWQICLPIARPAIMTVVLLTFIASWNAFLWPILINQTDEWRPVVLGLYNFTEENGTQYNLLMAASFITIMPMLVLYFITQKSFTEGLATTGLKG